MTLRNDSIITKTGEVINSKRNSGTTRASLRRKEISQAIILPFLRFYLKKVYYYSILLTYSLQPYCVQGWFLWGIQICLDKVIWEDVSFWPLWAGALGSFTVGPNLSEQREESEEWKSDGGEGSPKSTQRAGARVGSASTCHLPALTRPWRCMHAQACVCTHGDCEKHIHTRALVFHLAWATNKDTTHAAAEMRWLL